MQEEIWKDIPGYEGLYQVSNVGNVRSLDRVVQGVHETSRRIKGITLTAPSVNGYKCCSLSTNGVVQTYQVHQLVAMAFLNHKPQGHTLVVDHINNIRTDNRLENLQLVSHRHNLSKDKKGTSKYTGVSWQNRDKRWKASIRINGNSIYLGYFTDESEAAIAYQKALEKHESLKNC
jgi:hypothetical protein